MGKNLMNAIIPYFKVRMINSVFNNVGWEELAFEYFISSQDLSSWRALKGAALNDGLTNIYSSIDLLKTGRVFTLLKGMEPSLNTVANLEQMLSPALACAWQTMTRWSTEAWQWFSHKENLSTTGAVTKRHFKEALDVHCGQVILWHSRKIQPVSKLLGLQASSTTCHPHCTF